MLEAAEGSAEGFGVGQFLHARFFAAGGVALIHVALLRGEAGRAGITDISQKQGYLRFTVKDFDMEKVSALYATPEYKGRLRVEAGSKPCLSLKIKSKGRVIDEARRFAAAWAEKSINKA